MELLFIVPGFLLLIGVAIGLAVAALVIATRSRRTVAPAASQPAQGPGASVGPTPGGTIVISDLLGQLIPSSGGPTVTVVEGVALGRQHLNPDDEAITRGDHLVFHKVVSGSGTLVVAEILHTNGIEVGGRRFTGGRVQVADGATIKIGATELAFRKA